MMSMIQQWFDRNVPASIFDQATLMTIALISLGLLVFVIFSCEKNLAANREHQAVEFGKRVHAFELVLTVLVGFVMWAVNFLAASRPVVSWPVKGYSNRQAAEAITLGYHACAVLSVVVVLMLVTVLVYELVAPPAQWWKVDSRALLTRVNTGVDAYDAIYAHIPATKNVCFYLAPYRSLHAQVRLLRLLCRFPLLAWVPGVAQVALFLAGRVNTTMRGIRTIPVADRQIKDFQKIVLLLGKGLDRASSASEQELFYTRAMARLEKGFVCPPILSRVLEARYKVLLKSKESKSK